jgi:tRNA(Ile)-lysidine synthase TilS/MesJ
VCQNEGVEWIEDPSNQLDNNFYKRIRQVMLQNEEVVPGIVGLMKTCRERRRHLEHQGNFKYTSQLQC